MMSEYNYHDSSLSIKPLCCKQCNTAVGHTWPSAVLNMPTASTAVADRPPSSSMPVLLLGRPEMSVGLLRGLAGSSGACRRFSPCTRYCPCPNVCPSGPCHRTAHPAS